MITIRKSVDFINQIPLGIKGRKSNLVYAYRIHLTVVGSKCVTFPHYLSRIKQTILKVFKPELITDYIFLDTFTYFLFLLIDCPETVELTS